MRVVLFSDFTITRVPRITWFVIVYYTAYGGYIRWSQLFAYFWHIFLILCPFLNIFYIIWIFIWIIRVCQSCDSVAPPLILPRQSREGHVLWGANHRMLPCLNLVWNIQAWKIGHVCIWAVMALKYKSICYCLRIFCLSLYLCRCFIKILNNL